MSKTYVIAEIGINHNGDINLAKELIVGAYKSGCDAVKFQKRTVDEVYSKEDLDRPRESLWGSTNREQKEGLEFSIEQYKELHRFTKKMKLDFIVSCWDLKSVDLIEKHIEVDYHKVASALATNKAFLSRLNETNKPVILSTGMCSTEHIGAAAALLTNVEYILACTSTYPTVPEEVNLRHIITLKEKYPETKIGFSNHYNGHDACVGAVVLGAECIEFHITKDRTLYGSDQVASIENYCALLDGVRTMESMLGDGVKKVYETELPIEKKLRAISDIL